MSKKVLFSLAVVCVGALAFAGRASAQWSGSTTVGVVEQPSGRQNHQGVSAARCGNSVVVGFGDSEAGNDNSSAGYSASSDGGATFIDRGVLPNTPGNNLSGGGQEVLACNGPLHFYYASALFESNQLEACPAEVGICSSISVSSSSDGGQSWGMPMAVARQDIDNHQLGSPAIATDPTSPRIYVAYLDENSSPLDSDFIFPDCETPVVTELRVAVSADGGQTWARHIVDHICELSTNPETQGVGFGPPNILVSPGGKVYVTYEFRAYSGSPNEIRFTRSVNQANTFSTPIVVSTDAISDALPQLAVDRTTSSFRGAIYLTWSGMPRGTTTEVLMSDSLNQGVSFSFPRSVRSTSVGTQVNPVVAVDNDGDVASCYYVTGTNTPTSTSTYFYNCLTSTNHATSWSTYQKLATSAPPGFDALTSEFFQSADGFFTAFELPGSTTRKLVGSTSDNP